MRDKLTGTGLGATMETEVAFVVTNEFVAVGVTVFVDLVDVVDAKTDDNTVDARAELAGDGAILAIPFIAQLPKLILPNSYVAPPVIPVNTTAFTRDREVVLINVLIGILIPWKVVELTAKFGTL